MSNFISDLSTFLHMGGYAEYVWPAYLIAFAVLTLNLYLPLRKQHRLLNKLAKEKMLKESHFV